MQTFPSSPQLTVPSRAVKRVLALLALAMVAAFTLISAGSAHASGSGFHYGKWLATLSFPNNEPFVELTTEIWYKPANGSPVLVNAETEALDCTTVGNLQINNELATFTGQEYISCEQPDMVQKFLEVSQGAINLTNYNAVTRSPFVSGQLAVSPSAPASVTLPTFYHPSIQHGLARVAGGNASQTFRVDGVASDSVAYAQTAPYTLRAEFRSLPSGNYRAEFTANSSTTLGNPALIGSGLEVDLEETTIYFGYSPDSNSYFQGSIKSLTADPGAFGRD
jgi:hypothetical protein